MMERLIMLVDMDSFFAQVEQRNNPALRGKPILVGGNAELRHGVVAAASYEAKRFGVKSGMSYFEAKKLCPQAIMIQGNTDKYTDCCFALLDIFRQFTDQVECYSIDEAFLDVTNVGRVMGSVVKVAEELRRRVLRELNLTCSVGIGPNKLIAKMACKWDKPDGLSVVDPCELPHIIWGLPVDDIVGIGPRLKRRLNSLGVRSIGDLAGFPPDILRAKFGVYGTLMHNWANAIDDSPVDPSVHMTVKSMGHSYTLPRDISDREELRWYLFWLSDKVARRLRRDNYRGRTVSLVVRTADLETFSRDITLPHHINAPHEICEAAEKLLDDNFPSQAIRLLGIKVTQLLPGSPFQLDLYNSSAQNIKTLAALDAVKDKYGDNALTFATIVNSKQRIRQKIGVFLTNREKGNKNSPLSPPVAM